MGNRAGLDTAKIAERIRRVRQLVLQGYSQYRIAIVLRMAERTVKRYADPSYVAKARGARPGTHRKSRGRTPKNKRQFPVHPEIARLRDQLVVAFRAGDLEKWRSLSALIEQLLPTYHPPESRPPEQIIEWQQKQRDEKKRREVFQEAAE